ncbi:MAG: adenylyl-sulfate kinase [Ignavibacteriaceae bacterium]|jgi:adenylylsulfate kinase
MSNTAGDKQANLFWFKTRVTMHKREELNGHKSLCVWLTGLSGSGKSTLANELEYMLHQRGIRTYLLDGDNVRYGLNKDLGFEDKDRKENIRRVGEAAKLFVDAGMVVITSFISPFKVDREIIRKKFPENKFIEVFVDCDLYTCEKRDPKNLYKQARAEKISAFTGISSPYEEPDSPELHIFNGSDTDISKNVKIIFNLILKLVKTEERFV